MTLPGGSEMDSSASYLVVEMDPGRASTIGSEVSSTGQTYWYWGIGYLVVMR